MNSEDVLRRRIEEIDFYIKNYKEMIELKEKQKKCYQGYLISIGRVIKKSKDNIERFEKERNQILKDIKKLKGE